MVVSEGANRFVKKQDLIHIIILLAIALGIGIYLIATTVLIAKDGIHYIECAQKFSSEPIGIIKNHPFGYPFLIFIVHKFVTLFSNNSSLYSWVYTAQSVTLFCRVLAFIPLYFIGKILVGPGNSFWSLLILTLLPYPTEFGSDVLRDWPHILFLACGFWAILWGAKNRNWCIWSLAGLSAGLGYMVSSVCAQLIVYAFVWLGYCLLRPAETITRRKTALAMALLITGFLIPVGPYMKTKGEILPEKIQMMIRSFSVDTKTSEMVANNVRHQTPLKYVAGGSTKLIEATVRLVDKTGANLMWFFVLPWLIGIYYHFQKITPMEEKLLITAFIAVNIISLFLRYCFVGTDLTHRYVLPLTIFTIFYIPIGLKLLSYWVVNRNQKNKLAVAVSPDTSQKWFYIIITIGLCICSPKLFRPIRIEKKGYRLAAEWLKTNTDKNSVIAVPDRRITFYAERDGFMYESGKVAARAKYVVKIVDSEDETLNFGRSAREEHSLWTNEREKRKKLVIYRMM